MDSSSSALSELNRLCREAEVALGRGLDARKLYRGACREVAKFYNDRGITAPNWEIPARAVLEGRRLTAAEKRQIPRLPKELVPAQRRLARIGRRIYEQNEPVRYELARFALNRHAAERLLPQYLVSSQLLARIQNARAFKELTAKGVLAPTLLAGVLDARAARDRDRMNRLRMTRTPKKWRQMITGLPTPDAYLRDDPVLANLAAHDIAGVEGALKAAPRRRGRPANRARADFQHVMREAIPWVAREDRHQYYALFAELFAELVEDLPVVADRDTLVETYRRTGRRSQWGSGPGGRG